jgi:hypothetical protein
MDNVCANPASRMRSDQVVMADGERLNDVVTLL